MHDLSPVDDHVDRRGPAEEPDEARGQPVGTDVRDGDQLPRLVVAGRVAVPPVQGRAERSHDIGGAVVAGAENSVAIMPFGIRPRAGGPPKWLIPESRIANSLVLDLLRLMTVATSVPHVAARKRADWKLSPRTWDPS